MNRINKMHFGSLAVVLFRLRSGSVNSVRLSGGQRSGYRCQSKRGVRQLPDAALIELAIDCLLKRRTAEPHRDFIRAVRSARFAHLISVAYVAYSDTDGVRVGPGVR